MKSLAQLAYNSIPLPQVLKLETTYTIPLSLSSWEMWRDRAVEEFKIPPLYFDLPLLQTPSRDITGQFRYLEILTKFKLTPEAATYLRGKEIGGIYEALAGVLEAVNRDDEESLLFFFKRLRPAAKEYLMQIEFLKIFPQGPYARFRLGALRSLWKLLGKEGLYAEEWELVTEEIAQGKRPLRQNYYKRHELQEAMSYLISQGFSEALDITLNILEHTPLDKRKKYVENVLVSVLRSGKEEFLRRIWGRVVFYYFEEEVPWLDDVIPAIPFTNEKNIVLPVKRTKDLNLPSLFLSAAIYGGNARLVAFFIALNKNKEIYRAITSITEGSYAHPNPVGYYQVLQTVKISSTVISTGDVDLNRLILSKLDNDPKFVERVLMENLGNIDMLFSFLPLTGDILEHLLPRLLTRTEKSYPLSNLILRDYLGLYQLE